MFVLAFVGAIGYGWIVFGPSMVGVGGCPPGTTCVTSFDSILNLVFGLPVWGKMPILLLGAALGVWHVLTVQKVVPQECGGSGINMRGEIDA